MKRRRDSDSQDDIPPSKRRRLTPPTSYGQPQPPIEVAPASLPLLARLSVKVYVRDLLPHNSMSEPEEIHLTRVPDNALPAGSNYSLLLGFVNLTLPNDRTLEFLIQNTTPPDHASPSLAVTALVDQRIVPTSRGRNRTVLSPGVSRRCIGFHTITNVRAPAQALSRFVIKPLSVSTTEDIDNPEETVSDPDSVTSGVIEIQAFSARFTRHRPDTHSVRPTTLPDAGLFRGVTVTEKVSKVRSVRISATRETEAYVRNLRGSRNGMTGCYRTGDLLSTIRIELYSTEMSMIHACIRYGLPLPDSSLFAIRQDAVLEASIDAIHHRHRVPIPPLPIPQTRPSSFPPPPPEVIVISDSDSEDEEIEDELEEQARRQRSIRASERALRRQRIEAERHRALESFGPLENWSSGQVVEYFRERLAGVEVGVGEGESVVGVLQREGLGGQRVAGLSMGEMKRMGLRDEIVIGIVLHEIALLRQ